jgi:enoyl-CoA hydratase
LHGADDRQGERNLTDTPTFKRINVSRVGSIGVLALSSDKVNSLDPEVLREIAAFVDFCDQEVAITSMVMTGEGRVFSAGLNVVDLLAHEATYATELLGVLQETLLRIFTCPMPTVVAINGPAIAGGCLLACAFDKRLIADEARIGVTELNVGVAFPVVAVELLRHVCGARAEQLMFDADLLSADEACRVGLVHGAVPASDLQAAAIAAAETLASLDAGAYALAKESSRRTVVASLDQVDNRVLDDRVRAHWEAEETRASLSSLLKPKG